MDPEKKAVGLAAKIAQDVKGGELKPEGGDPPQNPPVRQQQAPPRQQQQPDPKPDPQPKPTNQDPPAKAGDGDDDDFQMRGLPGQRQDAPDPKDGDFDEEDFDKETNQFKDSNEIPFKVFADLRKQLKEYKKGELVPETLKSKLTELEEKAAKTGQYEEEIAGLRERVNKLASTSAEALVRSSDMYEANVEKPEKVVKETIKQMAELTKISEADIRRIVYEGDVVKQDSMIEALSGKLSQRHLSRIAQTCDDVRQIEATRADLLNNAEEYLAEQNRLRDEARSKEIQNRVEKVRGQGKRFHESFMKDIPGLVDENGAATQVARKIVSTITATDPASMTSEDEGFAIYAAAALPEVTKLLRAADRRVKALEAEINRREGGRPKPSDGGSVNSSTPNGDKPRGLLASIRSQNFGS